MYCERFGYLIPPGLYATAAVRALAGAARADSDATAPAAEHAASDHDAEAVDAVNSVTASWRYTRSPPSARAVMPVAGDRIHLSRDRSRPR